MRGSALIAVAVLLVAWFATMFISRSSNEQVENTPPHTPSPDAASELRGLLTASLKRDPMMNTAMARAQPGINEDWRLPLSQVVDRLQHAAENGDMQAAYVLGSRLARCISRLRGSTPEKMLQDYREELQWIEQDQAKDPSLTKVRLININNRFKNDFEAYEDCAIVGDQRVLEAVTWLEDAGHADVPGARLAYARYALVEYDGKSGSLIAKIEIADRRRVLARQWLEQLVLEGNEDALVEYADALSGQGALYTADRRKAMAYGYALDLLRSRRVGEFEQLWRQGPRRYGNDYTQADWDDISAHGRRIFSNNFERNPIRPDRQAGANTR